MGADALAFELHPARGGDESRARREQGASLGVRGRDALRGALARHSDTREACVGETHYEGPWRGTVILVRRAWARRITRGPGEAQ